MEISRKLKDKIPVMAAIGCCLAVLAISGVANSVENSESAMAQAGEKQVIILDPGHGGADGGGVGINGIIEKDINLNISKYLGSLLNLSGYEVVYTREEDISIYDNGIEGLRNQKVSDMKNRLEIVNKYPDSIFFSIHQNQYTDSAYFGGQMFYTTNNNNNFRLATIMQEKFAELQPGNDRDVKLIDNGLYLFKETKQPALLIECGFLSNPNDAVNLNNPEYQKKVAFTIYRGLTEYLTEVENKESINNNGETESFLYMQ